MRAVRHIAVAGIAALALSLAACSGSAASGGGSAEDGDIVNGVNPADCPEGFDTRGITDTEIKIGSTSALSGNLAAAGGAQSAGLKAYISMINAQGGIEMQDGKTRTIENTVLDDGYEPARARANADQLINADGVFALVGMFGTPGTLAARPLNTETCTPSFWMTSGQNEMGNPEYPWVAAPVAGAYPADGASAAALVVEDYPGAKIGVLSVNDDVGKAYLAAFEAGLEGSDAEIVAEATFDPTDTAVSAQITTLAGSGANVFVMLSGSGTYQLQALQSIETSGWEPELKYLTNFQPYYLDEVSDKAAENIHFGLFYKSAIAPENADDPVVKEFLEWWEKEPGTASFAPDTGIMGWQAGILLAETLRTMPEPTRMSFLETATHMTYEGPTAFLDGVTYSVDWPERAWGVIDQTINVFDPTVTDGPRYREVKVINNDNIEYADLG